MCECCHQEYRCLHGHHARHYPGTPPVTYVSGPGAELRALLEEEPRALEPRPLVIGQRIERPAH